MEVNIGLLVVLAFLILVLIRVPLFVALILPSLTYILANDIPVVLVSSRMLSALNSFVLIAVPLFIFVGSIMNHGGVTDKIFAFANDLVGHFKGGLAQVNIIASLIFSGISGSALADIGGIGRVLIQSMQDAGYSRSYSAALTGSSATIGPLFPPSIPLILFGVVAGAPVLDLLLAGIFPALLTAVLFMIATAILAYTFDFPSTASRPPFSEMGRSFVTALPALLTPVVLIFGMLSGYFGPTEAAAVTVVYILCINIFIYQVRNLRFIWEAAVETAYTTSVIMITVGGAILFSWVLTVEGTPDTVATLLFSLSQDPIVVLLLVNLLLLIIGLFLEPISSLLLSIPLVVPVMTQVGYDPVHIGVIMVFNLMIGLLTPPLGLSLYLSSDLAEVEVEKVIRKTAPYYVVLLVTLAFIGLFPQLSLWVPGLVD